MSQNFYSLMDELKENPDLGVILRKKKPSVSEELQWFSNFYKNLDEGNGVATVAEAKKSKVVGICQVERIQPGSYASHRGELGLVVRKEFRGRGIGTELMKRTLKKCKGKFDVVQLGVFSNNPVKKLYERMGFRSYGTDPFSVKRDGRYFEVELMYLKF